MTRLFLYNNEFTDISPLVENPGINFGDDVRFHNNPLYCSDPTTQSNLATLFGRGVDLTTDCTLSCTPSSDVCFDNGYQCGEAYHPDCPSIPIYCGTCGPGEVCSDDQTSCNSVWSCTYEHPMNRAPGF